MTETDRLEASIRQLPSQERNALVLRLNDVFWDAWDEELEEDINNGRLDGLIAAAEADIAVGSVKELRGVIDNQ